MKHIILFLVLFQNFFNAAYSQSSVWTIEGNGTKIYIGGSIHLLREQDYPLPVQYENAFNQSDILVLETDINPENLKESRSNLMGYTLYPNSKSLKTELNENVYTKLDSAFNSVGLTLERMIGLKPVMSVLTLTRVELLKLGVSVAGVDKYFYDKAQKQEKNVLFLEDIEYQVKLVSEFGEEDEDEYVLYSIDELDYYKNHYIEAIENWKTGDTTLFYNQSIEYKNLFPVLYNKLLLTRNNNWIPHLESYMQTPEVEFVLVGAGHLYGPDGILKKMKDKGYKIEQL